MCVCYCTVTVDLIKNEIESLGGLFQIKKAPFVDEEPVDLKPPGDPANPDAMSVS